jgi:hypothetical protein
MDLAKRWRQKATYYRLQGQRHRVSGEIRFPARPAALNEQADTWEPYELSGRGELYSFTVVRQVPLGFEHSNPYALGMVRLAEGPMVSAQLTDCSEEDLYIGQRVEMVTRRLHEVDEDGLLVYGYKFRPVLDRVE